MDPIRPDPTTLLIETLSSVGGETRARGKRGEAAKPGISLRDALRTVAAGVDPDDPASLASARLPLLRTILHARLGTDAVSDPLYGELLARLDADLTDHPSLEDMLRKAVVALKAR